MASWGLPGFHLHTLASSPHRSFSSEPVSPGRKARGGFRDGHRAVRVSGRTSLRRPMSFGTVVTYGVLDRLLANEPVSGGPILVTWMDVMDGVRW